MRRSCFGLFILLPILLIAIGLGIVGCSQDNVLSPEKQLAKDLAKIDKAQLVKDGAIIDKYLADKGITAVSDPSGLRYVMNFTGSGPKPTLTSFITVKYTGKLMATGSVFDQSASPPVEFTNPVSNLILSWQVGIPLMTNGGSATFYVPSGLAYGSAVAGGGKIPSNANLIFDVELIDFRN